ncbi:MAG: SDR family oxidoreductase [Nitrospirae bacterium]|nr:SDR family oxidoreductase [Nitrospirota bacterium]
MGRASVENRFDLSGRVALVTGGAGFLGVQHAEAIAEAGGTPVLLDLPHAQPEVAARRLEREYGVAAAGFDVDLTCREQVDEVIGATQARFGRIDVLVNNAALTGKNETVEGLFARFEEYPLGAWKRALDVNLTGTLLVTQAVGKVMCAAGRGVIVNLASDVGVISPDHRIYEGMSFNSPVSYSMCKAALLAFTRYLATYWAPQRIRVNALSPAGAYDGQDSVFVSRLSRLIPMGRMARKDEYKGAMLFLCSDASSFMTGANLVVDGGRTCW